MVLCTSQNFFFYSSKNKNKIKKNLLNHSSESNITTIFLTFSIPSRFNECHSISFYHPIFVFNSLCSDSCHFMFFHFMSFSNFHCFYSTRFYYSFCDIPFLCNLSYQQFIINSIPFSLS